MDKAGAIVTLLLVLVGCWQAQQPAYEIASAESTPELCMDEEMREKVRAILLDGINEALKDHVMKMYSVWMKDETDQPRRARVGTDQGIRAYVKAIEGTKKWSPPSCKTQ